MSLKDWKLCHGCVQFELPYTCKDGGQPLFNGKQCPCVECLLKMICRTPCHDLGNYLYEMKKIKKGWWNER